MTPSPNLVVDTISNSKLHVQSTKGKNREQKQEKGEGAGVLCTTIMKCSQIFVDENYEITGGGGCSILMVPDDTSTLTDI